MDSYHIAHTFATLCQYTEWINTHFYNMREFAPTLILSEQKCKIYQSMFKLARVYHNLSASLHNACITKLLTTCLR